MIHEDYAKASEIASIKTELNKRPELNIIKKLIDEKILYNNSICHSQNINNNENDEEFNYTGYALKFKYHKKLLI